MPHSSSFTFRVTYSGARVYKCPCGQTFESGTKRGMDMKLRLHRRFCFKLPASINRTEIPKKACTMREQQLAEAERMKKVHN